MDFWVLGEDDKYYYEPLPSSRTDEFIDNTRFLSKTVALNALILHETKHKNNPQPLYL
jgi:hypothetical protein